MSRLRFFTHILSQTTLSKVARHNKFNGYRFVANHKKPARSITQYDNVAGIRARLRSLKEPLSVDEWKQIREETLNSSYQIEEINVDATILGLCDYDHQLRIAQNYLEFLKGQGKTPNYATIGRVLRMYYPAYQKGELTEKDFEEILTIYRKFRSEHEVLDPLTCENLISALIITPQWKECLDLMDMIKVISRPTTGAYTTVIQKCFETEDDFEIGWELLKEMCEIGKQPRCEIFIQYLGTIKKKPKTFPSNLEKMLEFLSEHNIVVSKLVIEKFQRITNDLNYSSKITKLVKDGQCSNCKQCQPDITISKEEFQQLSSLFLERVVIRQDVFLKSTPEEVAKFSQFLERNGPYDCVLDGLNIAYSIGTKKNQQAYAKTLASVVKYFKGKERKMLVLGRDHMKKWPQDHMKYIKQNADLFLTNNLSEDDPFLLYATIKSGQTADFVSRDLMRGHSFLLGSELKTTFRRWQQQHQYMVMSANDQGKVVVKAPTKYKITASKVNSTWHIPFKEQFDPAPADTFEVPEKWLCLSPSEKK